MKKFCPNCGKPVKETDNICGNCGHKLKPKAVSSQSQTSFTPKSSQKSDSVQNTRANYVAKNKDHKKGVMWTCAGILAVVIIGGGIYAGRQYVTSKNNQATTAQNSKLKSSNKVAQSSTKKSTKTSHQEHSEYSNDEWMMMGYIAYKAKDSNTSQAIDDVKDYFSDGDLTAHKNSSTSYTLSNEYGSVDIDVKDGEVVVSNDGTSTFSKDTLKSTFGDDLSTIKSLVSYISKSSKTSDETENDSDSSEWKSGVPSNLIGSYKNYRNEQEEKDLQTVITYDFWKDRFTFWQSSDLTRFATNVKYKKIRDGYVLKFDEMDVGGGYHLPDNSPTLSNGLKYRKVPEQQLTILKEGNSIKIDGPWLYKSNSYSLPKTPEDMK